MSTWITRDPASDDPERPPIVNLVRVREHGPLACSEHHNDVRPALSCAEERTEIVDGTAVHGVLGVEDAESPAVEEHRSVDALGELPELVATVRPLRTTTDDDDRSFCLPQYIQCLVDRGVRRCRMDVERCRSCGKYCVACP